MGHCENCHSLFESCGDNMCDEPIQRPSASLICLSHCIARKVTKRFNVRQLNVIKPFLKFEIFLFSSSSQYVSLDVGYSFQIFMGCGKFCGTWKCNMLCYWIWCERAHPLYDDCFLLDESYCWNNCSNMWQTYCSNLKIRK